MQRKVWISLLLVFAPVLVGALASVAAQWLWNPVPVLAFKIDVGMVIFVAGVFVTLLLGTGYLGGLARERQARRLIEHSLRESEQGRQRFIWSIASCRCTAARSRSAAARMAHGERCLPSGCRRPIVNCVTKL